MRYQVARSEDVRDIVRATVNCSVFELAIAL
jgi:hypothetical protein